MQILRRFFGSGRPDRAALMTECERLKLRHGMQVSIRRAKGEVLDSDYYNKAVVEGVTKELRARYGMTDPEIAQLMKEVVAQKLIK